MMQSRWNDDEARAYCDRYAPDWGEDVALRVYTSQLIGRDEDLVLHGGGNTSVKSTYRTVLGEDVPALYVKGSGWDLVSLEPPGLPAVDLAYCRRLRALDSLSDEEMVNQLRTHMFDSSGPNPSVEALLHAFLTPKFVDHSHADAILALTNCVDADAFLAECFGDDVLLVPYVMPGFDLARVAADVFDANPRAKGMILLKHGLFTWGETARESYENHIDLVARAESFLSVKRKRKAREHVEASLPSGIAASDVLVSIRGALAVRGDDDRVSKRFLLTLRSDPEVLDFVNDPKMQAVARTGPLTPDHVIRTKALPLVLDLEGVSDPESLRESVRSPVEAYEEGYVAYFERSKAERGVSPVPLDPKPRIVLVPGLGLIGVGENRRAANIAADLYEHTIRVKTLVTEVSTYEALPSLDLFDVEYWSLEQAKLRKQAPKPLEGRVALITGGCGAIGLGVADVLRNAGAEVILADLPQSPDLLKRLGYTFAACDVRDSKSVENAFAFACPFAGGIDIVVANAGIAVSGRIVDIEDEDAQRIIDVNLEGYVRTVREAARLLRHQGTGGHIVIVSSKNVFAPGKEFSLYSLTKAGGHQLGRIAAMELAEYGIKVNMITPDAVFSGGGRESGLWKEVGPGRAAAHGIEPKELEEFYRDRNLLRTVVTAEDVGRAVLFFVTDQTPTTGASLPVDGGVPGAFPR